MHAELAHPAYQSLSKVEISDLGQGEIRDLSDAYQIG